MNAFVNSNVLDSVSVPKGPMVGNEIFGNQRVGFMVFDVWDPYKQRNPVGFGRAGSIRGFEVLSVDVEFPVANVNQDVELLFSVGSEEVVFGLVDESDSPSAFVEDRVGGLDRVKAEVRELGKHVLVGFFENSVRIELHNFVPTLGVLSLHSRVEHFLVDLQKCRLPAASVVMCLQVNFHQKRNQSHLQLEVVDLRIQPVLNPRNPLLFEPPEVLP